MLFCSSLQSSRQLFRVCRLVPSSLCSSLGVHWNCFSDIWPRSEAGPVVSCEGYTPLPCTRMDQHRCRYAKFENFTSTKRPYRKIFVFLLLIFVVLIKGQKKNEKAPRTSNSAYLVRFLFEKGADINLGNANGWTPLIYAIEGKKLENEHHLLDCGADVGKAKKDGKTFRVLFI